MEYDKILSHLKEAIIPASVVIIVLLIGYIVRAIIFSRISKWQDGKFGIGKRIINAIKMPMMIWFLMLGIYIALEVSKLPENIVEVAGKTLLVLGIFSITLVAMNIASAIIARYSAAGKGAMPMTSLTQNVARIVIFCMGILVILNTLGISITPIIATLGVGGLAVALALQDTLGNVFAGFYILISRQLRIGDYVKLDTGEEGYIVDITWRATKIRALPNNVILIPNEKLTKTICTNYYLPEKEMSVPVQVGVHYNSDLDKVEKVTIEVARDVMKNVAGGIPEFEPVVRFHTFADSSINFSVIMRAKEFTDQYLIKHEFIKKLQKRYAQEGITIPYPIRAINYSQEKVTHEGN